MTKAQSQQEEVKAVEDFLIESRIDVVDQEINTLTGGSAMVSSNRVIIRLSQVVAWYESEHRDGREGVSVSMRNGEEYLIEFNFDRFTALMLRVFPHLKIVK